MAKLGEGGMGVVWKAVQLSTHRTVALKLMSAASLGSSRARARFEREVELAAVLEHPGIARVYDSGLDQSVYYYAMEFVDGVPLHEFVRTHQLSDTELLQLFLAICDAIQFAHQHGVIHRDLKPSNILVTQEGKPFVLDFGLAKARSEHHAALGITVAEQVAGTPAYMAPEQACGHTALADIRADVYSLGKILFELLTSSPAHDLGGTTLDIIQRIVTEDVRRPRSVNPKLDRELEAILLKALARDPAGRYPTVAEFADDIRRHLNHDPVSACPRVALYFLSRRLYKRRKPLAVAATILLLLTALAAYYITDWYQQQAGWILAAEYDFTRPTANTDDFEFYNPLANGQLAAWPIARDGLAPVVGEWCFLRNLRLRGDTRVVLRVRFSDHPDGIDVCVNSRVATEREPANMHPPGYRAQFAGYGGIANLVDASSIATAVPDQASGYAAAFTPGQTATLTFQRVDYELSLQVDRNAPQRSLQLLPLTGGDLDRIGFRTWSSDLRVESLHVYRRSLPRKANPIVAGDTLVEAGAQAAALQQYLALADDYPASPTGELALAKASRLALLSNSADTAVATRLRQRLAREYPKSRFLPQVLEAYALALWREARYSEALVELEEVLHSDPKSRLALSFAAACTSENRALPPAIAQRLLEALARIPDLNRLNIQNLGVSDLTPLRGKQLVFLAAGCNSIESLEPLRGMPLRILDVTGNHVSTLEPIRGMRLNRLLCSLNPITSLDPIRNMPLEMLHIKGCPITTLDPLQSCQKLYSLDAYSTLITSVEPLRGLPLKTLSVGGTPLTDLSPLRGMKLEQLGIFDTNVADLEPLRGMPLQILGAENAPVSDLGPISGTPLRGLELSGTRVATLEPLRGMTLTLLWIDGAPVTTLEPLRGMSSLRYLFAGGCQLTSLQPFLESPPQEFLFDCDSLPDAELQLAGDVWAQSPQHEHLAICARVLLALRHHDLPAIRRFATTFSGHQYLLVPKSLLWSDARDLCASLGGHLATITSQEEHKVVAGLRFDRAWMGLRQDNGRLHWVTDEPVRLLHRPLHSVTGAEMKPTDQGPLYLSRFLSPWTFARGPNERLPFLIEWDDMAAPTKLPASPAPQSTSAPAAAAKASPINR